MLCSDLLNNPLEDWLTRLTTLAIAVLDWVQYSLSPSRTRYINENQMKAGEKIRAKIGLLGRLNIAFLSLVRYSNNNE
jgi:hypothetical protein